MNNFELWLSNREEEIIRMLKDIVELESPSRNKKLTDKLCDHLEELFGTVAKVKRIAQKEVGDNLKITFGHGKKKVLILCHMDTVFNEGEIKKRPFTIQDNKIYGPGVFDMKYSIVQMFYVQKLLEQFKIDLGYRIVLYINSDEETGSIHSRKYYFKEAEKSVCALVLETSYNGWVKTNRKGSSLYNLKIYGKASHAGGAHNLGISAIKEMAYQVLDIESMNEWDEPLTVNVGMIKGGEKHNIVPDFAEIFVDARFWTDDQGQKVNKKMNSLTPKVLGTRFELSGGMRRPPMEQLGSTRELYKLIRKSGSQIDIDIQEHYGGGASDGNFVASIGLPTIDGLGGIGAGAHSENEYIYKDTVIQRILLLTQILINLSKCKLDYMNWEEYIK